MNLLITYLISIAIALTGVSYLAVIIDQYTSPFMSLLIFFPMFFLAIYLVWKLAVKLTEPRSTTSA